MKYNDNRPILPFAGPIYAALRPWTDTLVRVSLGAIVTPHGFDKLFLGGVANTARNPILKIFGDPIVGAYFIGGVEFFGGLMLVLGLFNAGGALFLLDGIYGVALYPITRSMIEVLTGSFTFVPLIVGIYYAGELVWRERDRKTEEIIDSTPTPDWTFVIPKVLVISSVIGAVTIAAEFDRGTVRWAWTQSRSRQRWWRETTLVALASVIVLLTPLAVTMSWWLGATQYDSRYGTLTFLVGGWVLVPVAVSATVVTMVGGLVLRRPGWLVAVGVVVASAGYYNLHKDLATRLVPEQTVVVTNRVVGGQFTQVGTPSVNSDFLFGGYRRVGRTDTPSAALENQYNVAMNSCSLAEAKRLVKGPNPTSNETPAQEVAVQQICQSRLGIVWINIYIPESEFWTLQDRESAVFLAAGVVLWLGGSQWLRRTRA